MKKSFFTLVGAALGLPVLAVCVVGCCLVSALNFTAVTFDYLETGLNRLLGDKAAQ